MVVVVVGLLGFATRFGDILALEGGGEGEGEGKGEGGGEGEGEGEGERGGEGEGEEAASSGTTSIASTLARYLAGRGDISEFSGRPNNFAYFCWNRKLVKSAKEAF